MRGILRYLLGSVVLAGCDSITDGVAPGSTQPSEPPAVASAAGMKDAFRVHDIGTLGGQSAFAHDINERGEIAGGSETPNTFLAFLGIPGRGLKALGTLGGTGSEGLAINDSGDVAGGSDVAGDTAAHAFLWTRGRAMKDLGTLGGPYSTALGVNNLRQVAGYSVTADDVERAFIWSPGGGLQEIPTPTPGPANANGINDLGEVVGVYVSDIFARAFAWTRASGTRDLGTLGGVEAIAWADNHDGDIVGWSRLTGDTITEPFLLTKRGGMEPLGSFGGAFGEALDLNDRRVVVGLGFDSNGSMLPFVWTRRLGMRQLPISTIGSDGFAEGVNNQDQIVGTIFTDDGSRAVVWTPKQDLDKATIASAPGELFDVRATGPARPATLEDWCRLVRGGGNRAVRRPSSRLTACPVK